MICLTIFFDLAVEIFERKRFGVEVSSGLSCAANGRTCGRQQYPKLTSMFSLFKVPSGSGSGMLTSR